MTDSSHEDGQPEDEARQLGERIIAGRVAARRRGQALGGPIPFGLRVDPKTGEWVRVPRETDAIRLVYEMRKAGASYAQIVKRLTKGRYPAPGGRRWHEMTVQRIATNPIYVEGVRYRSEGPVLRNFARVGGTANREDWLAAAAARSIEQSAVASDIVAAGTDP